MQKNNWILPICVVLGAAAFGVAFLLMPDNKKDAPPAAFQPAAAANPGKTHEVPAKQEAPKTPELTKQEADQKDPAPAPKPQRPSYRISRLPAPEKLTGIESSSYDAKEITLSDNGVQALVKSKRQVTCLNVISGQIIHTFRPAKSRYKGYEPDTDFMYLSPDANYVLVTSESQANDKQKTEIKEITVQSATSGDVLRRGRLDERSGLHSFQDSAVFTPRGDYLLLPTHHYRDGLLLQAVAIGSGEVRMINVPGKKEQGNSWELTVAVPQEPTLLVHRRGGTKENAGGVSALDLTSGTEKPIYSLTVDPWNLFNRGVQISPDGKLVLSQGLKGLQVCDWRTGKRFLDLKIGELQNYQNGRFTPDGKRVVVQWKPNFKIFRKGVQETYSRVYLYDLASQKQIAEFSPEQNGLDVEINALTISRDGKTLVWGCGTKIIAMDFKSAFGIDPLPPAPRPAGPDFLPWK